MTPPHGKASSSFSSIYPTIVISLGAAIVTSALVYQHLSQSKTNRARKSNNKINDGDDDVSSKTSRERTNDDLPHREIEEISLLPQNAEVPGEEAVAPRILSRGTITIAYCSTTGTCAGFARRLHDQLRDALEKLDAAAEDPPAKRVQLIRVSEVDWWDELVNNEDEEGDDGDPIHSTDSSNKGNAKKGGSPILLFVLPTWTNGTLPPDGSESLLQSLDDISNDWRVAPEPLKAQNENEAQLLVGAFGMGSSAYDAETVGKPAKEVFGRLVGKLGARPVVGSRNANGNIGNGGGKKRGGKIRGSSLMIGDAEVGDAEISFEKWMNGVMNSIFQGVEVDLGLSSVVGNGNGGERSSNGKGKGKVKSGKGKGNGQQKQQLAKEKEQSSSSCCGGSSNKEDLKDDAGCACKKSDNNNDSDNFGCCSSKAKDEDDNDDSATDSISEDEDDDDYDEDDEDQDVLDVEDMGNVIKSQTSTKRSTTTPKEMVTPKQAKALKKEGYRLIGTHSAVKLCRWTKHQLRGRGGCYKHTHYGITSYQCMEATPSLACANKCVFCWRHHKNPVGREWRWKTDEPGMIVEEAVNTHVSMIKETKGIPGIQMDRWAEAHTVRHCALSLVGEPIMYPRINELLQELHDRKISTFLVTNGQHPQAIRDLIPITQLYVSVDAPTPESLEAVDRPLFRDAWDRLKTSLACLKHKGQRTVARLTVVKGWNSDEIGGYARLIALGHCSLVEVKGVTFCGKSDASNLNMSNTPWHHEVVEFTKVLKQELDAIREEGGEDPLPEYDLACEHKHSCSVLLARVDQFAVPDPDDPTKRKWRTWIDYDKFQDLAARHAADPTFKFGVEDYIADTPSWAVFGAEEEGFDPTDNRHRKKKRHPKYTRFDEEGIPTHDTFDEPLKEEEIVELREQMKQKKREVGDASTITEFKSGEKRIEDASLMFRGLVVIR